MYVYSHMNIFFSGILQGDISGILQGDISGLLQGGPQWCITR